MAGLGDTEFMRGTVCAAAMIGLLGSVAADRAQAAGEVAGPAARTLGFAVTSFPFALAKNADDCPDGMAMAAKDIYLASVPPAERQRLLKPENLAEFERRAYHTPDGKDLCEVPDYPRAPQRTPMGKVSFGMNLDGTQDGAATETTCAHEKFKGPNGEAGIDNQMYRIIGCSSNYRGHPGEEGYLESLRNSGFKDGGTTILIEVAGVKDGRNDADVTVGIYNGSSPMMIDPNGHVLPYASLTMTDDAKYRSQAHGRIANGVLTTDPADIRLHYDFGGYQREYRLKAARLRLELKPDGNATGLLAGYLDADDVDMTKGTKQASAEMVGYDCPTFSQAIRRYADGFKDPKTGKCTALSTAFHIEAIPAFVIRPEEARKTASVAPPADRR